MHRGEGRQESLLFLDQGSQANRGRRIVFLGLRIRGVELADRLDLTALLDIADQHLDALTAWHDRDSFPCLCDDRPAHLVWANKRAHAIRSVRFRSSDHPQHAYEVNVGRDRQTPLRADQDAYGQIYQALLEGRSAQEIMERDDGLIYCGDPADYLAPYRRWPATEKRAMRYVRGRVLDVGCGAGRVS